MSNLKDIKDRINNVSVTEKVTMSMKNIASAKLSQSRRYFHSAQEYFNNNSKILQYLLFSFKKEGKDCNNTSFIGAILACNNSFPRMIFVIGSDRGFCGSFNINIIKKTETHIKELKNKNVDFFIVGLGSKIQNYFSNNYRDKFYKLDSKLDISSFENEEALLIANYMFSLLINNKVGSVDFIYTSFTSVLECNTVIANILPVNFDNLNKDISNKEADLETLNIVTDKFIEDVTNNIIKDLLLSWVWKAIINSLTSEYSARVSAMDSAASNSKELLESLSLKYNRTRQDLITKELIEIISGNEAL